MFRRLALLILFLLGANKFVQSQESEGWTQVTRNEKIDWFLENLAVEIKTDSTLGSDELVYLELYINLIRKAGEIKIKFSSTPQYLLSYCTDWADFPTTLPSDTEKIWRMTVYKRAGIRVKIHCNGELVLNILLSDDTCTNSDSRYRPWNHYWSSDVKKLRFYSGDTASDYYRPYTSEECREHLGCWADSHSTRTFEEPRVHFYAGDARDHCHDLAVEKGYTVFGLEVGHECWTAANALETYQKHGEPTSSSYTCRPSSYGDGMGGPLALDVYKIIPCEDDGGWSSFGDWSECSADCDGGFQIRTRHCNNPAPRGRGRDCEGEELETRACNSQQRSVDGGWSSFGNWSECSAECDRGFKTRTRHCNNPAPRGGGADCVGEDFETQACNIQQCTGSTTRPLSSTAFTERGEEPSSSVPTTISVTTEPTTKLTTEPTTISVTTEPLTKITTDGSVDGGWSDFGDWSNCSAECDGGFKTRIRHCNNPAPRGGGADCVGEVFEVRKCNIQQCPENEKSDSQGHGKWNGSKEESWEAILYGYVIDPDTPSYLGRGDKIFDIKGEDVIAISSEPSVKMKFSYSDSENTAAKKLAASMSVKGHYLAFSAAASMEVSSSADSSIKTIRMDTITHATKYEVASKDAFRTFPARYLTEDFKKAVKSLSSQEIEEKIGVFYVWNMNLGGEIRKSYTMQATSEDNEASVKAELQGKYGSSLFGLSAEASLGVSNRFNNTNSKINVGWSAKGGDTTVWLGEEFKASGDSITSIQQKWADTITDDNLYPFNYQVGLMWDLVKYVNQTKGYNFQKYLEDKWSKEGSRFTPWRFLQDPAWRPVIRGVDYDFDLENVPLEISMSYSQEDETGTEDPDSGIQIRFHDANGYDAGCIVIHFGPQYFYLCRCTQTSFSFSFPSSTEMIWRITLDKSSGIRVKLHCNNVLVYNYLLSLQTCNYETEWSELWSRDVSKITFTNDDTVSSYYRPFRDWRPQEKDVWFPHAWDDIPLVLKTVSSIGSNDDIYFEVSDNDHTTFARVVVRLSTTPIYYVRWCRNDTPLKNFPDAPDDVRIWKFIKHGFEGISIECNGVEVADLKFSEALSECSTSKWTNTKVNFMNFNIDFDKTVEVRATAN